MATIIVFQTSEYKRGEGKATGFIQTGELVQNPKRPNAPVILFHNEKEKCLKHGVKYSADYYKYEDRKNRGAYRDGYENFVEIKE